MQSLILAKSDQLAIYDSTRGLFLFGTPHQGLEIDAILKMIRGRSSRSIQGIVRDIGEGSNFVDTQRDALRRLWDPNPNVYLVSFFETMDTKALEQVRTQLPT